MLNYQANPKELITPFFIPIKHFFFFFERKDTKNFLTLHTNRVLNKLKKASRSLILPFFSTLRCHTDNSI